MHLVYLVIYFINVNFPHIYKPIWNNNEQEKYKMAPYVKKLADPWFSKKNKNKIK